MHLPDINTSVPRVDARVKATGAAEYVADLRFENLQYARTVRSDRARAILRSVQYPELPEGYSVVDWRDIPPGGKNRILMITDDWPAFARDDVRFIGQTIALFVGPDRQVLDELVRGVDVEYEDKTPAYTFQEAMDLKDGPIHGQDNLFAEYYLEQGDPESAFRDAARIIEEEFFTGYQEHLYLEPQGCIAAWEDNRIILYASMQCPFYLQKSVAHTLGCSKDAVRVIQPHTGGGFGGKEHYPDVIATAAAVAARKIGRPVQLVLDRLEDIQFTPKRHPSWTRIRTALNAGGAINGMDIDIRLNAGAFETCSTVVLQRAVFHATGVYHIPNVRARGRAYATNMVPSDAFRGFGAPQALFAVEMHMNHVAVEMETDPINFKRKYFLRKDDRSITGGTIYDHVFLDEMLKHILDVSGYARTQPGTGNGRGDGSNTTHDRHHNEYRGIGISVFNHGCAFTGSGEQKLINGKISLVKSAAGRVRILAAGVDMGQGVLTTFRKVVARIIGIPISDVLYDRPDTDMVPDSGPTCASRSIMVVGYLLQEAAKILKASWTDGEAQKVDQAYNHPTHLHWDQETFTGDAYPSYGWGVNAVAVSVDPATYEVAVEKIWTIYDVGVTVDRLIVEGQAHGGMIQGLGYAGLEKLDVQDGKFLQGNMADYVIPTSMDFPSVATQFIDISGAIFCMRFLPISISWPRMPSWSGET